MPYAGTISTYESGVNVVVEWKVENYFNLSEMVDYWSPDFSFGGERWCLGIYPNGWRGSDSSGHVDVNLSKYGSDRSIKQTFSLSLKTAKGKKYNEQHFLKDFDNANYFHIFYRFIARSELSRRRSDLVPDGTLTIICTMKSSTSAGSDSKISPASAECHHCKGTFNADSLSSHQKKCMHRPVKCPDCLDVVGLKKWFDEHECQQERPEGEACASGCSANPHQNKLNYDFKELFLKKEDCDVTIKVEGSEFPSHRVILKARSPVFASTFRHDMKENATGVLEIEDCDPSTFSDFLCFLYCGDVGIISQENVFGLFTAADKYQVLDLRVKCLEFIKKNLAVDIFCETITLALQHSETELIKLSTDYFTKNAPKIIVTVKWQTFLAENPTESNELLVKLLVPDSSSSK